MRHNENGKKLCIGIIGLTVLLSISGYSSSAEKFLNRKGSVKADRYTLDESVQKLCEAIRNVDFTIQEYPINTEAYDTETDRKYKEAFLAFIFDKTYYAEKKMQAGSYCTDFSYRLETEMGVGANEAYIRAILEEVQYWYLDFDGDGLPELVMNRPKPDTNPQRWNAGESQPLILKYDFEKECAYLFFDEGGSGMNFMCSGSLYYHKDTSYGVMPYILYRYNSTGCTEKIEFFNYTEPPQEYYISYHNEGDIDNVIDLAGYVSRGMWDKLTKDFFDAIEHVPASMTFEEVFGDMAAPYIQ